MLGDTSLNGFGILNPIQKKETNIQFNNLGVSKSDSGDKLQEISSTNNIFVSQHLPEQTKLRKHEDIVHTSFAFMSSGLMV